MDTISVIVPVYNIEGYLGKCIDSIIAQTYKDLEIILVDDGSSDHCGAICDEYAKKDNRIKVIHKPNGGLSDARNHGIEAATGRYLGFVDGDDWIEEDMYEHIAANIEKYSPDCVITQFYYSYPDKEEKSNYCFTKELYSREDIFGQNLYEAGLGEKIEGMVAELYAGKGAVREVLHKYVSAR